MNRFLAVALGSILLVLLSCQSIKRFAIRGEIKTAFSSTLLEGTELNKIGDNLYSFRWLTYRTAFITTPKGVILFDPINKDASRAIAKEIQKVAPNPEIKYVIYSHGHRDHVSGAGELPGEPIILAHANAARDLKLRSFNDVVLPTKTFSGPRFKLEFGGVTLDLIHLPYSHTDGNILIHIPDLKTLFQVDIVWPHQLPPAGAPMSFFGVKRAVKTMLALDFETMIPGHGDLGTRADIQSYDEFLADGEREFRRSLKRREMGDFHAKSTFLNGTKNLADVFFDVEDALKPKYGHWDNFASTILPTTQWIFWGVLIGD